MNRLLLCLAALAPGLALALAVLAPAVLAPSASAQSAPLALPTRDAAVTYVTPDRREVRLSWLAAAGKLRAEGLDEATGVLVLDLRNKDMLVLIEAEHAFVETAGEDGPVNLSLGDVEAGEAVTRAGRDRIAGQDCTVWRVERRTSPDEEAEVRSTCVTADGIMLRQVEGEGAEAETTLLAIRVSYAAQDPSRYRPPAGWTRLSPDAFARRAAEGAARP